MRIAFAGTPAFAASALQAIIEAGHEVAIVLTQPDRPAGRGLRLQPSAVKQLALRHAIPVLQPAGLRLDGRHAVDADSARQALIAAEPEVMIVAAYGLILPAWVLELPRNGCLNIHASLLPRWRGAAPIQRAIEAGDTVTGVTIMQMDAGLDTGAMLRHGDMSIDNADTGGSLQARLADLGARLIVEALAQLSRGPLTATPQPAQGVTYASKIVKAEATIDWRLDAGAIERRLRAFDPFPGATFRLDGDTLKAWRGVVRPAASQATPGEIVSTVPQALVVACGAGSLELTELQRPGGRRQAAALCFPHGGPALGTRLALAKD